MIELHPRQLVEDGKQFVVLSREEFEALEEEREEMLDLVALAEAKAEQGNEPFIPHDVLMKELGL